MDEFVKDNNLLKIYKYYYCFNYSLERLSKLFKTDINILIEKLLYFDEIFKLSYKYNNLKNIKMNVNKLNFINNKISYLSNNEKKSFFYKDNLLYNRINNLKNELLLIKSKILNELQINSYLKYNATDIIHLNKNNLLNNGYLSINEWINLSKNIYIGSSVNYFNIKIENSIWANPYSANKYGEELSLILYENFIRNNIFLYEYVENLKNKQLGCNCKNKLCHGLVLLKILNEKIKLNNDKIIPIQLNDSEDELTENDDYDIYNQYDNL